MQTVDTVGEAWEALQALPDWQGFLLVAGGSLAVAIALRIAGAPVVKRITTRIPGEVDDVVARNVYRALYLTVAIVGAFVSVTLLSVAPDAQATVHAAALTGVTLVWVITLVRTGRAVSTLATESRYVDKQVVPIVQNVWSAVLVSLGALLVLAYWKIDVTPLLASAGIAGIVLGLAARDTVANFFGSIALYLDGTYTVGDYLVLGSGERGRVEDVSVRSTVIRTRDDVLVTVPNAELNSATIVNESTPRRKRRIRIPVGVAYGSDLDAVETALLDAAKGDDQVLDRPTPRVRFREFGDSALQYELLCWIPNPAIRARVVHRLNRTIYDRFRADGIEIPFPQRQISVTGDDGTRPFAGNGDDVDDDGTAINADDGTAIDADDGTAIDADDGAAIDADDGAVVGPGGEADADPGAGRN